MEGLPRSTIEGAGSERNGPEDDPDFDTSEDDPFEEGFGHLISEVNLQSSAARFLLKTREERKRPCLLTPTSGGKLIIRATKKLLTPTRWQ